MSLMNEMLSQEEIDALLKKERPPEDEILTEEEIDALGEIGNISMGTSATTLYSLLKNKVTITTPNVEITDAGQVTSEYPLPFLAVNVEFTEGIEGTNLLLVKDNDAKIIADLMMGGNGKNPPEELGEMAVSAVSEAMNQMIGSAATSLSTLLDKPIHISPPQTTKVDLGADAHGIRFFEENEKFVRTSFKMVVGDLIDSEIMQLLPIGFSKEMVASLIDKEKKEAENTAGITSAVIEEDEDSMAIPNSEMEEQKNTEELSANDIKEKLMDTPDLSAGNGHGERREAPADQKEVKIQPVTLKDFEETSSSTGRENINLILDVPLNVTVELGRTKKQIREILQFGVGTIVELDKLAGEPVELMVNGKFIAKGEVVVIDENFGVRITDIVHPSKRINSISQ
jgi:flagellar motor switch protein FliN/FliY